MECTPRIFGIVYKARDPDTQEPVAVKVVTPSSCGVGSREFELMSKLNHPSIVKLLSQGQLLLQDETEDDKQLTYGAMEFCPHGDLHTLVSRHKGLPETVVRAFIV